MILIWYCTSCIFNFLFSLIKKEICTYCLFDWCQFMFYELHQKLLLKFLLKVLNIILRMIEYRSKYFTERICFGAKQLKKQTKKWIFKFTFTNSKLIFIISYPRNFSIVKCNGLQFHFISANFLENLLRPSSIHC